MRILFIEDETKITDALQELCKIQNIDCDVANDGEEGLLFALNPIYDVIVLDIMLPLKSGLEILKEVRDRDITTPSLLESTTTGTPSRSGRKSRSHDTKKLLQSQMARSFSLLLRMAPVLSMSPRPTPAMMKIFCPGWPGGVPARWPGWPSFPRREERNGPPQGWPRARRRTGEERWRKVSEGAFP